MNYYILYCQTVKTEKVCQVLRGKGIDAFIPRMEVYIHIYDKIDTKVMFPGYLFVRTELEQDEFASFLSSLHEERDGIIKELKKSEVSALRDEEIDLLNYLLDKKGILKMSEGYKRNGRTIVTKGPLIYFNDNIIDTNKRDMIAVLNIRFLERNIKAGLKFRQDN